MFLAPRHFAMRSWEQPISRIQPIEAHQTRPTTTLTLVWSDQEDAAKRQP